MKCKKEVFGVVFLVLFLSIGFVISQNTIDPNANPEKQAEQMSNVDELTFKQFTETGVSEEARKVFVRDHTNKLADLLIKSKEFERRNIYENYIDELKEGFGKLDSKEQAKLFFSKTGGIDGENVLNGETAETLKGTLDNAKLSQLFKEGFHETMVGLNKNSNGRIKDSTTKEPWKVDDFIINAKTTVEKFKNEDGIGVTRLVSESGAFLEFSDQPDNPNRLRGDIDKIEYNKDGTISVTYDSGKKVTLDGPVTIGKGFQIVTKEGKTVGGDKQVNLEYGIGKTEFLVKHNSDDKSTEIKISKDSDAKNALVRMQDVFGKNVFMKLSSDRNGNVDFDAEIRITEDKEKGYDVVSVKSGTIVTNGYGKFATGNDDFITLTGNFFNDDFDERHTGIKDVATRVKEIGGTEAALEVAGERLGNLVQVAAKEIEKVKELGTSLLDAVFYKTVGIESPDSPGIAKEVLDILPEVSIPGIPGVSISGVTSEGTTISGETTIPPIREEIEARAAVRAIAVLKKDPTSDYQNALSIQIDDAPSLPEGRYVRISYGGKDQTAVVDGKEVVNKGANQYLAMDFTNFNGRINELNINSQGERGRHVYIKNGGSVTAFKGENMEYSQNRIHLAETQIDKITNTFSTETGNQVWRLREDYWGEMNLYKEEDTFSRPPSGIIAFGIFRNGKNYVTDTTISGYKPGSLYQGDNKDLVADINVYGSGRLNPGSIDSGQISGEMSQRLSERLSTEIAKVGGIDGFVEQRAQARLGEDLELAKYAHAGQREFDALTLSENLNEVDVLIGNIKNIGTISAGQTLRFTTNGVFLVDRSSNSQVTIYSATTPAQKAIIGSLLDGMVTDLRPNSYLNLREALAKQRAGSTETVSLNSLFPGLRKTN